LFLFEQLNLPETAAKKPFHCSDNEEIQNQGSG